ncbi:hypothetical protein NDU88_007620 [Pleurodeles waltl]|uniref:Uncharacterized protein n=1 Tax=Pleurodeles waltl TaxID=8319 RepID=A0AAV7N2K9_PLEWA|nr:hypothetical protein NDU88_007620 [Pleurodeles waltl]
MSLRHRDANTGTQPDSRMDLILQEITAASKHLEGMDSKISELTVESHSILTDIAGFQDRVTGLDHHLCLVKGKLNQPWDEDQQLQYLRDKLMDLEDRSRRDNVCSCGIPEGAEGVDVRTFLRDTLPTLTSLTFSLPLELQQADSMPPPHKDPLGRPRPIIACFLWHKQAHQLLTVAHSHGRYGYEGHELRIDSDFSRDINEKWKAFLLYDHSSDNST